MAGGLIDAYQDISDMKSTAVVFICDLLRTEINLKINTIDNKLTKYIYLSWDQNTLEEEFVDQDY